MKPGKKDTAETSAATPGVIEETVAQTAAGFPVVGIGASAGGLAAFEAFFSGMPADTNPGMAFVVVQHLAPDHQSFLTELIRRYTRMQVFEVEDGMTVQPNCAYIIPPNRDMAFLNGALQLLEPSAPRGQRLPIDFFFRSLAQDQHERAICIVLSGTGSDGTQGVRAIKGEGGMVMAQNPASAEYDGKPRSAIATGLVDYELPPAEMPAQLIAYVAHAFGHPPRAASTPVPQFENALKQIFVLLRAQTSHDFSQYKPSTIQRRVERRMALHQLDTMDDYVKYLQEAPAEVEALFRDLLIGVTNFFRDAEAFAALEEQAIPKLFAGKPADAVIRVWVPGCSTGEEAYSIAILLAERQEVIKQSFKVQIFATDIDRQAIATARGGRYPAGIAADLTPVRIARFFTAEVQGGAYRIHKGIRDMLVFSEQNVINDPPFSKLDLISCRNLLIYLDGAVQKKLFSWFHNILNPGGFLFLGTSESVDEADDLFALLDRKAKLYQRQDASHGAHGAFGARFLPSITALNAALPRAAAKPGFPVKLPLRALTEQALLQQVAPAGALVNGQGDILYLHGRTSMYLELAPGEAGINNILKMARQGLQRELTTALRKAARTNEIVRQPGLRVKTNGHYTTVNLVVRPVVAGPALPPEAPLFLVILEEAEPVIGQPSSVIGQPAVSGEPAADGDARVAALTHELRAKDAYLQSTNEALETANEELTSANEEMQSVNEELRSANEELATSQEELRSANEELHSVNTELQTKAADTALVNSDMNNLLAGTDIATVFVDDRVRILRFTPAATQVINVIHSDAGRPLGHVTTNLVGYDRLVADVQAVLATLVPVDVEVQTTPGMWYLLRIRPYRTMQNEIVGAVITFVDITEIQKTRAALRESTRYARNLIETSLDPLVTISTLGKITDVNTATEMVTGCARATLIGSDFSDYFTDPDQARAGYRTVFTHGYVKDYPLSIRHLDGHITAVLYNAALYQNEDGSTAGVFAAARDVTEMQRMAAALRKANDLLRLAVVVRDAHDAITVQDMDGRIIAWNPGAVRLYGWSEAEALAMNVRDRIPPALREEALATLAQLSRAEVLAPYLTQRLAKDGTVKTVSIISTALAHEAGQVYAIATTERGGGVERLTLR
ncbi:MAG: PAS domain S-box protein [bacterium]|nr:PAS domain S-box protein [bacterium]